MLTKLNVIIMYFAAPDPPSITVTLLCRVGGYGLVAHQADASPTQVPLTVCPRCGANAHPIWRSPLPADLKGEMHAFQCKDCGKQTKIIVAHWTIQ
jgi:hypothetical protein